MPTLLNLPKLNQKRGNPNELIDQMARGSKQSAPIMAVRKGNKNQDLTSIITSIKASVAQNLGKYGPLLVLVVLVFVLTLQFAE